MTNLKSRKVSAGFYEVDTAIGTFQVLRETCRDSLDYGDWIVFMPSNHRDWDFFYTKRDAVEAIAHYVEYAATIASTTPGDDSCMEWGS